MDPRPDTPNRRVRVVIVDDHAMVAEALGGAVRRQIGLEVVATFGTGEELLKALHSGLVTDVVVLDLSMPGMGGAPTLRAATGGFPHLRVLVVSGAGRPEIAARCIEEGARGFISKAHPEETFVSAIRAVADGRRYVDPDLLNDVIGLLADSRGDDLPHRCLSAREFEVMKVIAQGSSIKDTARLLHLSPKTVSTYRARVLQKMGLRSNAELTAYVLQHRLVEIVVP